jgi:hypothetical protein
VKDIKLKPAQVAERAETLAQLIEQANQLESDRAEINKDYKKRIESLTRECTRLARVIRTGVETVDNQLELTGEKE